MELAFSSFPIGFIRVVFPIIVPVIGQVAAFTFAHATFSPSAFEPATTFSSTTASAVEKRIGAINVIRVVKLGDDGGSLPHELRRLHGGD